MTEDLYLDENSINNTPSTGGKLSLFQNIKNKWHAMTRKQRMFLFTALGITLLGIGIFIFAFTVGGRGGNQQDGIATDELNNKNKDGLELIDPVQPRDHELPLTGELVTKDEYDEVMKRLPLAIIVENHPDARPQTGLDQADLVYESLVEGGITRFVPVFLSNQPEVVGPVRSVRKYFLDFISGLGGNPLLMHIGGATSDNPEANALAEIQRWGIKSLGISGGNFWRVDYRYAPHNAYTNAAELWEIAESKGWTGPIAIQTWEYQDEEQPADSPVSRIQVNWSGWGETPWSSGWEYDAEKNVYNRSHVTEPHVDAVSGNPVSAKNVVVVFAPFGSANDGTAHVVYNTVGQTGHALVFRDGEVIDGSWSKPTRTSRFTFTDVNGNDVEFNRGNTWILVAPIGSEVNF